MTWQECYFKGQKIFAKTNDDGSFLVSGGRVEIKYNNSENAKIYHASLRNLSKNPKDHPSKPPKSENNSPNSTQKQNPGPKKQKFDELIWKNPVGQLLQCTEPPSSFNALQPPKKGDWEIYTDGACSGNPGPCAFGIVIRTHEKYLELSQYLGKGTNNIAELYAICVALKLLQGADASATIHTDSQLSINLLTKNWKPKVNIELVNECKRLLKLHRVKFVKVKAHAGIPQNERADTIAVDAVKRAS